MKKIEIIDGKLLCSKCHQNKDISEFYLFNGRPKRPCKECKIEYQGGYYLDNKDDIEVYKQNYYQENKVELIANQLERDGRRKDEIADYQSEYRQENKVELQIKKREYKKVKRQNDPSFKLRGLVSNAIFQALKYNGSNKGGASIIGYLAYSMPELKEHLEKQFEPWMTWDNWGTYDLKTWDDSDVSTWKWNIDHIVPQSKLSYMSMEDYNFKKCWALENLRPLSAKHNIIKGNK